MGAGSSSAGAPLAEITAGAPLSEISDERAVALLRDCLARDAARTQRIVVTAMLAPQASEAPPRAAAAQPAREPSPRPALASPARAAAPSPRSVICDAFASPAKRASPRPAERPIDVYEDAESFSHGRLPTQIVQRTITVHAQVKCVHPVDSVDAREPTSLCQLAGADPWEGTCRNLAAQTLWRPRAPVV